MSYFVDKFLVPLCRHIFLKVQPSVFNEVLVRAVQDSANYAESANMKKAMCFRSPEALRAYAFDCVTDAALRRWGLIVEFGVWRGASIKELARATRKTVFGFDSFQGLKDDWRGWELRKGAFDLGGILPNVPPNVSLIKGWFDKTLPRFLSSYSDSFAFVHIDSDTYEAAKCVFDIAAARFAVGTVVLFDEYFGYRNWRDGEYKAWAEFVAAQGIQYEYLGFSDQSVAVRITAKR